jgi:hypothetical protein
MLIQLVEINDNERVSLHYETNANIPKFIQYWNYEKNIKPQLYTFKKNQTRKNKSIIQKDI